MGDYHSILQAIINIFSQPFILVNSIMPHEIKDFGLAIKNLTFNNLYNIKEIILNYLDYLGPSSPFVETLRFLKVALYVYLNILYLCYILRLVLFWFPNVNPYVPPYYILVVVTQPALTFINTIIPVIFGLDLSFIIVSITIQTLSRGLMELDF